MPRVTVVIPSYNCAPYVEAAVASVLDQSFPDFELIVVDDGSGDNTAQVLERFRSDPRFRYHRQENRGLPGARNAGVRISHSEYLAFLDADDLLDPDALRRMVDALDRSGASWCLIDILKARPEGREVQRSDIPADDPFHAILRDDFIRRGMFFRRDAFVEVGMYDEEMKYREDWDLNIRMFAARKDFTYLAQPLYVYTWREGSITTGKRARVLDFTARLLRKNHRTFADAGDRAAAAIYAGNMWTLGRWYFYDVGMYRKAAACMLESLRYDPSPGRLLHPLLHHARRLTGRMAPGAAGTQRREGK